MRYIHIYSSLPHLSETMRTKMAMYSHPFYFLPLLLLFLSNVSAIPTQQQQTLNLPATGPGKWTDPPSADETGNLIFNSLNGFLKHQPNALYRNGHAIVAGTVNPGTLLYHGSNRNCTKNPPDTPEWVSFDPEHSYLFGSRMYTFQVSRPLKVLYFDGSSAAKMPSGPIDTQEILLYGELEEDMGWRKEGQHITDLCEWGKEFGLDGFLRMEFDFEIMICDFSVGLEVVSVLDLLPTHGGPGGRPHAPCEPEDEPSVNDTIRSPPAQEEGWDNLGPHLLPPYGPPGPGGPGRRRPDQPITPPPGWVGSLRPGRSFYAEAIQAGNWHDLPGLGLSVQLDYTRMVTFFDPKYKSLVHARRIQRNKGVFRAGNVTKADAGVMLAELSEMLRSWDHTLSEGRGIQYSWATIVQTIVERYSERLEYLSLILGGARSEALGRFNVTESIQRARWQVLTMLNPYMPVSSLPAVLDRGGSTWLDPTIRQCSDLYTSRIPSSGLTSAERLIKDAVGTVAREICRSLGIIWLDAFGVESRTEKEQIISMAKWYGEVKRLMGWLGWASWTEFAACSPACGAHEFCALLQWFEDMHNDNGGEELDRPYCHSRGLDD
ncbi:hypothetical protein FRB93_011577 [Tulasnella sp. JGI-2019a]|nr:hypothetical protein FRB93_011577 [Tulasnella sp. JGI-2019a]